ncbi:GNAT family N-acetyltransferase [Rothia aerolata]|uniref:Acetyltransferase n=1 Tax=Rothia aerolata TaxID=1812262 RepID=A0A917ISZ9_9MICC|nr:GNAT family N-acetyltransferase [Rothia aerolata]GGH61862.1 acetyltransferase [Rothia aerolata]
MFVAKHFNELTLEELNAIYIIRAKVFAIGLGFGDPDPDLADREAIHLMHEDDDGRILAYMRLMDIHENIQGTKYGPVPDSWTLSRVSVLEETRGTGLGRRLLEEALDYIKNETDAAYVDISAQAYLKDTYYKSAGFKQISDEYDEAGMPHVRMIKKIER